MLELKPTSGSASQDASNKVPNAEQAPKARTSPLPVWINKVLLAHLYPFMDEAAVAAFMPQGQR